MAEGRRSWLRPCALVLLPITAAYVGLIGVEMARQVQEWPLLHRERDFPAYYLTARRLWHGQDFYSGLQEEARTIGLNGYFIDAAVTPPTFSLLLMWLPLFSYPAAWTLWQILSLAALGLTLLLIAHEMRLALSLHGWLCLGCAVFLFPPLTFHMMYAHTELFILLGLTGAWALLRHHRELPAGILIGLVGAIRL